MSWWWAVLLQYHSVLQSTTPILLRTTNTTLYYPVLQITTQYYSVLLQYYLVLQSTTPVLTCTTKYYSNTTLYYKVLLQYHSTLQILLCTLYYSSTTLYYKVPLKYYSVLLQYYLVLQSTTPVLPRTTKYFVIDPHHIWNVIYNKQSNRHHPPTSNSAPATQNESDDWSPSHMKRHLQCAEQQASPSNLTKYCASHAKWISWLIRIAYATSFTMRGATGITLQPHQVLRLPRKMNLMIDPHHIWNVIYNAWSNRHHPPTAPNTAPATQNECHDWSCSPMKRHFQCAEQQASPSNLTKYCACHAKWISWLIRITYETSFTMRGATVIFEPHQILRLPRKMISWLILLSYETSFTMRGATGITFQPHQILRLPRKVNVMIDRAHLWRVISNARSNRHHPPTSPSTAPATQNESHDWSASHMKRHLQCVEQQASPSNRTKYCACHAKWMSWLIVLTYETSFPMRRAARVTLPLHQILRLPHNMNVMIDPAHVWNVIYNARSNRYQPATSPNTAPATQNCIP